MVNPIPLAQSLELRDASGSTLGVFVSEAAFRELIAERDRLRKQVAEQQTEIVRLQNLNGQGCPDPTSARTAAERDVYRQAFYALTREELAFTEEELADLKAQGASMADVIRDIEQMEGMRAPEADHE